MSRRILVVTGTRAEFGLLRSTMSAVENHAGLQLVVVAAGAHLLAPARTVDEVAGHFNVAAEVEMQIPEVTGRPADAVSLGRGVSGFADVFSRIDPDLVVVLGDRIEAYAAASVAAIAGIPLAHIHGGDRAEGVADDAMRHAITQLADLHFPATDSSGERIIRMGQSPATVHVVGSPAVDDLEGFLALDDDLFLKMGSPLTVVLQHGCGLDPESERAWMNSILDAAVAHGPVLALDPNHDPGSDVVRNLIRRRVDSGEITSKPHLPRGIFVGLLRRIDALVGNSSAGLIEASVVGCPSVNIGPRQAGRDRPESVIDVDMPVTDDVLRAIQTAAESSRRIEHPYGEPGAGARIASILAAHPLPAPRKRLTY